MSEPRERATTFYNIKYASSFASTRAPLTILSKTFQSARSRPSSHSAFCSTTSGVSFSTPPMNGLSASGTSTEPSSF